MHSSQPCSRDLTFLELPLVSQTLQRYRNEHEGELLFLDAGGGNEVQRHFSAGYSYFNLDIREDREGDHIIVGDICQCPQVPSDRFDICFSFNTLEHVTEPWSAAEECTRVTKPGGLLIVVAPFAWRYHPVPEDYYRFTHKGLAHLFERTNQVETLHCGYDVSRRRMDLPSHREDMRDEAPRDELGGWRENWEVIYIARKRQHS